MYLTRRIVFGYLMAGALAGLVWAQSGPVEEDMAADPAQDTAEAQPARDGATGDPFGLTPQPSVARVTLSAASPDVDAAGPWEGPSSVSIEGAGSETAGKIRAVLQTSIAVEFHEAPLAEVVDYLKDAAKIPIVIDKKALDDVGLGADTPVSISMQDISLRSLLRMMLAELGLTFVVRDDVLKITTTEQAESELETRLYPVADLAQMGGTPIIVTRPPSPLRPLCDLVQAHVAPDSWDAVGGAGTILPDDAWGFLAVSQTDEVHETVEALLATVRRARETVPGSPPEQESLAVMDAAESTARTRIEEALRRNGDFEFNEAPLCEVVDFVKSTYGIPVYIDKRALDDVGLGNDTPVTISLKGIPLGSALRILLGQLELTHLMQDEVLKFTTHEETANHLTRRVFLVRDFSAPIGDVLGTAASVGHCESLVQMIQRTIAPNSWDAVGGAGRITAVESWGLLVVTQTDDVLRQISGMLSAARRVRSPNASPASVPGAMPGNALPEVRLPTPQSPFGPLTPGGGGMLGPMSLIPDQNMVLKPYVINAGFSINELAELIKGSIPGYWQQYPGPGIFPVGNLLLIRQSPGAHVQIVELLRTLRAVAPDGAADPNGSGGGF